jgi:hypothetical protein
MRGGMGCRATGRAAEGRGSFSAAGGGFCARGGAAARWGLVLSACVALSALNACTLQRPEGAFDPVYDDPALSEPPADFDEIDASTGVDAPATDPFGPDDPGDEPKPDRDGGGGEPTGDGGGGPTVDPELVDLLGDYWVRIDEYTNATSTVSKPPAPSITISVNTRTSYLGMAQIRLEGGALVSREVLCQQSVLHDCRSGCVNGDTKTTVSPDAIVKLHQVKAVKRELSLDRAANQLIGNTLAFPLGYDGSEDSSLPTRGDDPRVWDVDTSLSGKEGFLTQFLITVRYAGITRRADCRVSRALRLVTSWKAPLKKQGGSFQFASDPGTPSLDGSDSVMFAARGYQDASDADCEGDSASSGDKPLMTRPMEIRFLKVQSSDVTRCPSIAEYDQRMPAAAP